MAFTREELSDDVTLYLGDCLEVLPTLGKVDAVVTDPPYGIGLGNHSDSKETRPGVGLKKQAYESYDDTPENFEKIVAPAIELALGIADRGAVFTAGSSIWMLPVASAIGGVYMPSGQGRTKWGFQNLAHCLFYGIAPDLHKGARNIVFRSCESSEKNGHPCPKPLGWMEWAVGFATRSGETALDPFMGSGTTGVAAVKLGRKFIGIEIDPKYYAIARERIQTAIEEREMDMFKDQKLA